MRGNRTRRPDRDEQRNAVSKVLFGIFNTDGVLRINSLDVDIGFAFLPEYCGKGYAYEAAMATLLFGKKELGLTRIVSITEMSNTRSINLLKRLGLEYEKTVRLPYEEKELLLFSLPRMH